MNYILIIEFFFKASKMKKYVILIALSFLGGCSNCSPQISEEVDLKTREKIKVYSSVLKSGMYQPITALILEKRPTSFKSTIRLTERRNILRERPDENISDDFVELTAMLADGSAKKFHITTQMYKWNYEVVSTPSYVHNVGIINVPVKNFIKNISLGLTESEWKMIARSKSAYYNIPFNGERLQDQFTPEQLSKMLQYFG
jgi:hypothetical protein